MAKCYNLFILGQGAGSYIIPNGPTPRPRPRYLHDFANDPVEKAHQLAGGQLDLLFQLVHGLVLQADPQEESLEGGKSQSGRGAGPGPSKH